jgi:hypothetical protein
MKITRNLTKLLHIANTEIRTCMSVCYGAVTLMDLLLSSFHEKTA